MLPDMVNLQTHLKIYWQVPEVGSFAHEPKRVVEDKTIPLLAKFVNFSKEEMHSHSVLTNLDNYQEDTPRQAVAGCVHNERRRPAHR
jgi:hypothetical protein